MALLSLLLPAVRSRVADFDVQRALPRRERRAVGPVCFLDHMGPHTGIGGPGTGVGPHPHIGLSTVTWLFEGKALHRDSLGTEQLIRPGEVNWMKAGRGIVHSERTPPSRYGQPVTLHGLQLWVALPREHEEDAPSFQHAGADALPTQEEPGVKLTVVLGSWRGSRSPVQVASPTLFVVAELQPGAALSLPAEAAERALYVAEGELEAEGATVEATTLALLGPGQEGTVRARTATRVAVLGGEPLEGPRFMWWNFVSSRRERLEQARADWLHRRFPLIPGDSEDRVPAPGEEG